MKKGSLLARGRTADVYEWGSQEVLKLFHNGNLVENEVKNCGIINSLGLRIPVISNVIECKGRKGIIYERIFGKTLLHSIEPTESSLTECATLIAALHVDIHNISIDYPSNLKEELKEKINRTKKLSEHNRAEALQRLNDLPDDQTLCHYDFHPDNIILSPNGPIIIDWSNALIGHPHADVMRSSLMMTSHAVPPDPPKWLAERKYRLFFHEVYLSEYTRRSGDTTKEIHEWIIPTIAVRLDEIMSDEVESMLRLLEQQL